MPRAGGPGQTWVGLSENGRGQLIRGTVALGRGEENPLLQSAHFTVCKSYPHLLKNGMNPIRAMGFQMM